MRFAYYSKDGSTICWAARLHAEGHEVLLYINDDHKNVVGQGIVHVASNKAKWLAWGKADKSTIFFFDCTDYGELADSIRKAGYTVCNGGSFQDRLEKDRKWGSDIAEKCGISIPPTKTFSNITSVIEYLKTNPEQEHGDGGWAWKPDKDIGCDATLVASDTEKIIRHVEQIRRRFGDNLKCILQEKIAGVAVSTARWWNGLGWVGPYEGTIENKKFLNDNLGVATGCSFNVLWFYLGEPRVAEELHFEELADVFKKHNAPPGLYDINCIFNEDTAWFLEWTPRLGVDSEVTSQRGITDLGNFIKDLCAGQPVDEYFNKDEAYFDVRLSVPPYPVALKEDKSPALGVQVRGEDGLWDKFFVMSGLAHDPEKGLHCADDYGLIGHCVTAGNSMAKSFEKIYDYIKEELEVPDLQYRTDAAKVLQKDLDEMKKFGWESTPVLRK